MDEKQPEQEAKANALRVYHVETGEALATHQDVNELASELRALKLGEAVIIRPVVIEASEA